MNIRPRAAGVSKRLLDALSRTTASGRSIPEVDDLRFIAIGA